MPDVRVALIVALGAALGGAARYVVAAVVIARAGAPAAPLATLGINVSGSLLIGLVAGVVASRPGLSPLWRAFLGVGILGGYTTFSTFSLDALDLARGVGMLSSAAYVAASVLAGIGAAAVGLAIARAL